MSSSDSDYDKLRLAITTIIERFSSIDKIMDSIGLTNMPFAQRYGIFLGCCVFILTISIVIALLIVGGTFHRIMEQEEQRRETGSGDGDGRFIITTNTAAIQERERRALLFEHLLEKRKRMEEKYIILSSSSSQQTATRTRRMPKQQQTYSSSSDDYYPANETPLTKMLLNVAPPTLLQQSYNTKNSNNNNHIRNNKNSNDDDNDDDEKKQSNDNNNNNNDTINSSSSSESWLWYQNDYITAYRRCQDHLGGTVLSGRPESRFEAYARGYAGCGPYVSTSYRRSYAKLYENICCIGHGQDDQYQQLFMNRPYDIHGKYISLQALESKKHLQSLYDVTNGQPIFETPAYHPNEIWAFRQDGPFLTLQEMEQSYIFQKNALNQSSFAIINAMTTQLIGVIMLLDDDPKNLSITLDIPIVHPSYHNGDGGGGEIFAKETIEACFLLMDRLFGYGYRRIQCSIDAADIRSRKLCSKQLKLTSEGILYKHMIIKNASRDSHLYSMLNTDWYQRGARAILFATLYGHDTMMADIRFEKREHELEQQQKQLLLQKHKQQQQNQNQEIMTTNNSNSNKKTQ